MLLAIVLLVTLAALIPAATRILGRNVGYLAAAVFAGLGTWFATLGPTVLAGDARTEIIEWLPAIDVALRLRLDALGWLFALIVLGIGAAVQAYAARYFDVGDTRVGRVTALLTVFAAAMLGLVLADDVLVLFVFWELTSITSFFLIGGLGEGKPGALRALLTTALGGLALLAAVLLLANEAGTFALTAILASGEVVTGAATAPAVIMLLLLAVATKSAQLPFHFWLPGAMVAPTPVSTYLHAATMVKAGTYLLFRFTPLFGGDVRWQVPLVLLGLTTAVFGAVVASNRTDLKALLAYSTISQLGLLTALIGIGTPLALAAAALHTLAHALYKATLFMTVGIVDHACHTRDIRELGGLRRHLPLTAAAGGLAAISMAGLPPLVGFVSKEEAFAGFIGLGDPAWLGPVAGVLAVVASIGTVVYSARYFLRTFTGPTGVVPAHGAATSFALPAALTAGLGLVLGLVVPRLDPLVNAVAVATTGTSPDLHLALWHGLTVPLAMSGIVVGAGGALIVARARVERFQDRTTMFSGAGLFDRIYDGAILVGRQVGRQATPHAPAVYLLPVVAILVATGLATASLVTLPAGPAAASQPGDWIIIVLLAACIVGVVQARSRFAAVATLGLAGFTVAGWFVLIGAPDLALTQLLVETLTVAVVVVVFRRLPPTFLRGDRRRKGASAVIAIGVGIAAGAATYLLTGRRELSEIGGRLLAEGEGLTGGINVVNTILVDFRALDTLGEITVIATAAAAIVGLVRYSEFDPVPRPGRQQGPSIDPDERWGGIGVIDSPILRSANTLLAPIMILASLWLLVRGHDAVGGGFIGGLTAGAAVVLLYFSRGHERIWRSRLLRTLPLAGVGLAVAIGYGLSGLTRGAFLAGAKVTLPGGLEVAASLVFDVGVYIVVVAVVVAVLRHLGQGIPEQPPDPERMRPSADAEPASGTVDDPDELPTHQPFGGLLTVGARRLTTTRTGQRAGRQRHDPPATRQRHDPPATRERHDPSAARERPDVEVPGDHDRRHR